MADSSPKREKSIREKVLYSLKVAIKYGNELREDISDCLEKELGVSKDTLSNKLLNEFDTEVRQIYDYLPVRMKKCARNKSEVVRKSSAWFAKKIELIETPDIVEPDVVETPDIVETPDVVKVAVEVGFT